MLRIEEDGVTYINISIQGKTPAGRYLSNGWAFPFKCEDGEFISINDYWIHLTENESDFSYINSSEFQTKILNALELKLLACPYDVDMPITHYHVDDRHIIFPQAQDWILNYIAKWFCTKVIR